MRMVGLLVSYAWVARHERLVALMLCCMGPIVARPGNRHEEADMNVNYSVEGAKYGISFGTALAIAISYTNNHSILWAIIHGFFSWLYVIYFALFK
jgi:hypothetical protein